MLADILLDSTYRWGKWNSGRQEEEETCCSCWFPVCAGVYSDTVFYIIRSSRFWFPASSKTLPDPTSLSFLAAAAKSLRLRQTLCNPIEGSPSGSPVPGILQARTLEWVAISFSNSWKWKVKVKSLSRIQLLATPRTAAYQAPPSTGFSRQKCWNGLPLPFLIFLTDTTDTLVTCFLRILNPGS